MPTSDNKFFDLIEQTYLQYLGTKESLLRDILKH